MAIDAPTMLLLTMAIALIAALFLAGEWRATRDGALLCWSAGFAAIALGCAISPLRQSGSALLGVWAANGLLIVAHLMYLRGVAHFTGRKVSALWWAMLLPWAAMLAMPMDPAHSASYGVANASLVGLLALRTAALALTGEAEEASARRIGAVFLAHGVFYGLKTALIHVPGAFVNMLAYKGLIIQVSLLEGILAEVLLALLMAAAVRLRLQDRTAALADRDPLTGVLNRRAFAVRAETLLRGAGPQPWAGALLVIDVDHFKDVNDTLGHGAGDRLLLALARGLTARMPEGALVARLGGDEFAMMAPDIDPFELPVIEQALRHDFATAALSDVHRAVTLSIGAAYPERADDLQALLARADAALYAAKRGGRNRLSVGAASPNGTPATAAA